MNTHIACRQEYWGHWIKWMDIQCLRVGIFSETLRKYRIAWFYCCRECWFLLYIIYYVFSTRYVCCQGRESCKAFISLSTACDVPGISTMLLLKEAALPCSHPPGRLCVPLLWWHKCYVLKNQARICLNLNSLCF